MRYKKILGRIAALATVRGNSASNSPRNIRTRALRRQTIALLQLKPGDVGEYNGKSMANPYLLCSGSCATPRSHLRASYHNFSPSTARWQYSGLRLARNS